MSRNCIAFVLCFFISYGCKAQISTEDGVRFLTRFYSAYIANDASWEAGNREKTQAINRLRNSLLHANVSKDFLIGKINRMELQMEADAMYQWQELSPETASTLEVSPLRENWFRVRFWWNQEEKTRNSPKELSVCLTTEHDSLRIKYVTPLWNGSLYGDSLFYKRPLRVKIDHSSPEAFLRTFYKAYTMGYTSLQVDLEAYIGDLRKKYLLPAAMEDIREREELLESDGRSGYDLLIEGFIFDRLWEKHLKFIPQAEELSYKLLCPWTATYTQTAYLILKLVRQGSEYRIGQITIGYEDIKDRNKP